MRLPQRSTWVRLIPLSAMAAAMLVAVPTATAQSTRPTIDVADAPRAEAAAPQAAWDQAVARLADAVRGKDLGALAVALERGPVIRTFASDQLQPPERLLGATTGSQLLGVHAYLKPPTTLASDLAADFGAEAAREVPEHIRREMTPADDADAKRANETAAQWVVQTLNPSADQPVGVIVLWRPETDRFISANTRPLFLLVKGQIVDGHYVFRQVTFGDPFERSRAMSQEAATR